MTSNTTRREDEWDEFWRAGSQAAIAGQRGAASPALDDFWKEIFHGPDAAIGSGLMADLACGAGAVSGAAKSARGEMDIVAVDMSPAAVLAAQTRLGVAGIAASCADLPFGDGVFRLSASQFGIEYAGLGAFSEAGRVLAADGAFAALVHMKGGAIELECRRDAASAEAVLESGVLAAVVEAFEIAAGKTGPRDLRSAMAANRKALAEGAEALKLARTSYGDTAAGGLAVRIYGDIARLFSRMSAYDQTEVSSWSARVEAETRSYVARMSAMISAALDEPGVKEAVDRLEAEGVAHIPMGSGRLNDGGEPIAWILRGRKAG